MAKKKSQADIPLCVKIPSRDDLRWGSGVDYESRSDNSGCTCDYMCKCSRIVSTKITDIDWRKLTINFISGKSTELYGYCVERMLRRLVDREDFEVLICSGYYGEQTNGVSFTPSSALEDAIRQFNGLSSDSERLQFVLRLEYGNLLPELEGVSEWEIREVLLDSVKSFSGQMNRVDRLAVREYTENLPPVIGICLPAGEQWGLVDGHHRLSAAQWKEEETVQIIVPKDGHHKDRSRKEDLRRSALAKLTYAEKEALGLL